MAAANAGVGTSVGAAAAATADAATTGPAASGRPQAVMPTASSSAPNPLPETRLQSIDDQSLLSVGSATVAISASSRRVGCRDAERAAIGADRCRPAFRSPAPG
jgi:hypothetical protein